MEIRTLKNGEKRGTIKELFKKKENYLLVDTETVNEDRIIIEFSGTVINNNLLPQETFSYIIKEVWENKELMQGEFVVGEYAYKIDAWKENLKSGKSKLVSIIELNDIVNKLIETYKIELFSAYNAGFDKKAYCNTLKYFKVNFNRLQYLKILDIWYYASVLFVNNDYIDFCIENDFVTPAGNYKTSAEIMYRYLSCRYDFLETHLAIDDIEIELDILRCCAMIDNKPLIGIKQMPCFYINDMKKIKRVK